MDQDQNNQTPINPTSQAENPAPPPSSQPPQPTKSKPFFKTALIIFSLIVIITILFIGFNVATLVLGIRNVDDNFIPKLSPVPTQEATAPDPTANWKTYISSSGFQLKYPSEWTEEEYETEFEQVTLADPTKLGEGGGLDGLILRIYENPNSLTLEDFAKSQKIENGNPRFLPNSFEKNHTSLGIDSEWIINRNAPGAGPGQEVLIANKTNVVYLYCGLCTNQLFDRILSTFKFTNANSAVDTSTWKTYSDENFIFKYPDQFTIKTQSPNKTEWKTDYFPTALVLLSQPSSISEPKVGVSNVSSIDENKTINIGHKTAKSVIYSCGLDCYYNSVYFENNGNYYELKFNIAGGGAINTAEQILSTFKFTN